MEQRTDFVVRIDDKFVTAGDKLNVTDRGILEDVDVEAFWAAVYNEVMA